MNDPNHDSIATTEATAADPVTVVRRYLDALVAGDREAIKESFAEDAVWSMHGDLPVAGPWIGRDQIVDDFLNTVAAKLFTPGTHVFEFPTLFGSGETVALEWRVQALSALGTPYDNSYCGIFVVRYGRIVEVREYLDSRYAAQVLFPEID